MLLQVVANTGYIRGHLDTVGQAHPRDLTQGRVRLLRRGGVYADAHPSLLRTILQRGGIRPFGQFFPPVPDKLVNRGHASDSLKKYGLPAVAGGKHESFVYYLFATKKARLKFVNDHG
jgi:hypothetical protein